MQFVYNFVLFFFHFYFDSFQTTRPGSHANAEHRILQGRTVSILLISIALIGVVALRIKIHYLVICYHVTPVDGAIKAHVPLQHTPIPLQFLFLFHFYFIFKTKPK